MSSPIKTPAWCLKWTEELSVYIPEIDAEHQHFILLVNELNEAITHQLNIEEIKKRMQAILEDAAAHFSHEEALFREWGYPGTEDHAQKHKQIMLDLNGIMQRFEHNGTDYEWIEAGLKVKAVLIDHLLTEDMKYRDYCMKINLNKCEN